MKITIQGQDYSRALDAARPLTIERKLNKPTVCEFALSVGSTEILDTPQRSQYVMVTTDEGEIHFTGYIMATPVPEYAGFAMDGPRVRLLVRALSDDVLLDEPATAPVGPSAGVSAGTLMANLVVHTGSNAFAADALTLDVPMGSFTPRLGASFSKSAGRLANEARAAYRALNGSLTLAAIPTAIHALREEDGTLTLAHLSLNGSQRTFANDITVCGEHEPAAYVTEYFLGDGVTTQFYLSAEPYFPSASKTHLIDELFAGPAIDTRVWRNPTGSNYFTLGVGGLAVNGGNGIDGQTQLTWIDPVEMGGTLLLEAEGLSLQNGSTGVLAAFFAGVPTIAGCVAGFEATAQQGTGVVSLQPIVLGCASGASLAINPLSQYTLRIRVHCPQVQRSLATYRASNDDGLVTAGGGSVPAPAKLLFEIQEFVDGVGDMPMTLYDGSIASLPAACSLAVASSANLHGSLRALRLSDLGTGWVTSTPAQGTAFTRRIGSITQSAECQVERSGKLLCHAGFVPAVGEQIAVNYRTASRSVGRAIAAADPQQAAERLSAWVGSIISPSPRSSVDCRNAAAALAQAAASTAALWSGTYRTANFEIAADVWPGDALAISAPSCGINAEMIVREVKIAYGPSIPDLLHYEIRFANDWAEDLAMSTSATVPADAWLPVTAQQAFAPNLNALTVTGFGNGIVAVNTGIAAPAGGGFEVRRRDHAFLPGEDPDLILRGTQQNLILPRLTAGDRFYIRIFDGATPPNYSEFSAALFFNMPVSSG